MAIKICKDCGTEVSKSAKVCPKCGKKLKHTAVKTVIIIAFVIIISAIIGENTSDTISTSSSKINNDSKKYVELDVQELYNDFEENEISANKKYSDNNYYFTGTIYNIKHFLTDNYIEIRYNSKKDRNKTIELTAYFVSENELLDVKKGDKVTVYGKFYQRSFDNYLGVLTCFSFKNCTFNKDN